MRCMNRCTSPESSVGAASIALWCWPCNTTTSLSGIALSSASMACGKRAGSRCRAATGLAPADPPRARDRTRTGSPIGPRGEAYAQGQPVRPFGPCPLRRDHLGRVPWSLLQEGHQDCLAISGGQDRFEFVPEVAWYPVRAHVERRLVENQATQRSVRDAASSAMMAPYE